MKKKISLFLAASLLLSLLPRMVLKVTATEQQKGDGWGCWSDYVFEDSVVIYPVQGGNIYFGQEFYDGYEMGSEPITEIDLLSADSTVTEVIIPSAVDNLTVTSISEYAFQNCSQLTYVEFPPTIEYVWGTCFMGCTNLKEICIAEGNPNCYTSEGVLYTRGFSDWTNAEALSLEYYPATKHDTEFAVPQGVTSIAHYAFADAVNLRSISIPNSVRDIQSGAFGDNYSGVDFTDIYYEGSEEKWKEILVGGDYAYDTIESALIHFNRYEPFAKSIGNNTAWNSVYYDYVIQDRENADASERWEWVGYELVYLDDDTIPELWITYSSWAEGCRIVSYRDGKITQELTGSGTLSYEEYGNVFHHSYGHMGLYFDTIFKLENGELVTVAEGRNETTINDDGSQNYDVMNYFWNDVQVSEEVYVQNIDSLVSPAVAKETSDDAQLSYDEILDYLSTVVVEPSEIPVKDQSERKLVAYTAFPESTIGTNQEVKILFSMYADDMLVPIENYMIDYSKPGVLEQIDSVGSGGSRIITFKGLRPGTVDVNFTDIDTNATKKLTITVEDQCNYFRCSAFPIPDEFIGSIYIADYSCKANENRTHDISFNAYNASYAYGVVEVYSEDGLLIRCEPLEPKSDGSGMEKVANGFKWIWEDIKDLFDGDTAFYTKDKNAKHTPVNLKNVPENAEIIITSDGEASGFVTLYTGVDVFVRTVFAASSIDLKTEGQVKTVKELMSALVDALIKSISHDKIEGGIKEGLIKEATKSISTSIAYASSVDSISEIYQTVSNLFQDLDIDAESIMLNVLKGMGYGVADTLFTTAVPLYKIVNFVDLVLETAWPLVDYDFNVGRGKMEIHVCKHGLQNFVVNNSVTITQQSEFSETTVLDAYVVADDEELVALTETIVEDMSNFEVYNITLRTNGVEVQPDGDIEVRLPIPDGAVGKNCVVYRIEEDGTKTLLPSTYQDGFITFTTSHLSYYVVGEAVNVDSVDEPESNFGGNIVAIVMVAAVLVLTVGLFFRKKAKK